MTINKYLFSLIVSIYLTGCSTSPYSYFGNPTLEQVLNDHAEKVQSLPNQADKNTNQENTAHLEQMYQEWIVLKPKIEQLVTAQHKHTTEKEQVESSTASLSSQSSKIENTRTSLQEAKIQNSTIRKNYTIQIGASGSEQKAIQYWYSLKRKHPDFLAPFNPNIEYAVKDKKHIYRIKIGTFGASKRAQKACDKFKRLGGQCIVKRNRQN